MKVSRIGVAPHSPTPAGRDATVSTSPRQRMRTVFVPHRQNRRASNAPLYPAQSPHGHPERRFTLYIGRESFSPKKELRLTIQRDSLSGRGGHKKRRPVPEPPRHFVSPYPCRASPVLRRSSWACTAASMARSASKPAPLPPSLTSLTVAFPSRSPVRRRAFGVFRT